MNIHTHTQSFHVFGCSSVFWGAYAWHSIMQQSEDNLNECVFFFYHAVYGVCCKTWHQMPLPTEKSFTSVPKLYLLLIFIKGNLFQFFKNATHTHTYSVSWSHMPPTSYFQQLQIPQQWCLTSSQLHVFKKNTND